MLTIENGFGTGTGVFGNPTRQQILKEIDLAGNVLRETNADIISEQLMALGTDPIGRFNHDAFRLPNGMTAILADSQRMFPAGTQGSPDPIAIVGATIAVLDQNWQAIWYWNSFDHAGGGTELDINRAALRGETCTMGPVVATAGCPPVLIAPTAADWLHANSLQYVPNDGSMIVSLRNQDWVIKVDYGNGSGTGQILWRLGQDGDFALNSSDPHPWFSAQHEASYEDGGIRYVSLFDNGNSRVMQFGGNSRGQLLDIDEVNRTATLVLNADLGIYTPSVGSAQKLSNGNFTFMAAYNFGATPYQRSIEVKPDGTIVFNLQGLAAAYRGWRMKNLYSPPGS
jgi:hypothetical protein